MLKLALVVTFTLSVDAFAQRTQTAEFKAKVVSITDSDTIIVLREGVQKRIRLYGIDCPEKKQPFGTRAKQFTGRLAHEKTVTLRPHGKDRNGRIIAEVILPDGRNLNHEIVKAGFAWWFRKYAPTDKELARLEAEARKNKRGIWSEPEPIAPWLYRAATKATARSRAQ